MKRCRHCQQTKEDSEFYSARHTGDGLNSWCRDCMKASAGGKNGETRDPSTLLVRGLIEKQGIPCFAGRGVGMAFVDLVAWGCVPIEAKTSRITGGSDGFSWKFSILQREHWFDGLIAFVAVYPSRSRLFLVPANIPEIRYHPNGKQRANLYADFGTSVSRRRNYDPRIAILLRKYENAYGLIEEYRLRASELLKAK